MSKAPKRRFLLARRLSSNNSKHASDVDSQELQRADACNALLDLHRLEELICKDLLVQLAADRSIQTEYFGLSKRFPGLASRGTMDRALHMNGELHNVCVFLKTIVHKYSKYLPIECVAEIHSYIGCLHEVHGDFDAAAESYICAVWMLAAAHSRPTKPSHHEHTLLSTLSGRLQKLQRRNYQLVKMQSWRRIKALAATATMPSSQQ